MSEEIVYSDLPEDIGGPAAEAYAREAVFFSKLKNNDGKGIGKWRSPDEVPEEDIKAYLKNYAESGLDRAREKIRDVYENDLFLVREKEMCDDGKSRYVYGGTDDVFHTFYDSFTSRLIDKDGRLFAEDGMGHDSKNRMELRLLTYDGKKKYTVIMRSNCLEPEKWKELDKMFRSEEYSVKPCLAEALDHDFDTIEARAKATNAVNPADTQSDPFGFRALPDGWVDRNAYDARMGLLSDEDRKYAEKLFNADSTVIRAFFGGSEYSGDRAAADTMFKLISTASKQAGDELYWTDMFKCRRIFSASYWGKDIPQEKVTEMSSKAAILVSDFNKKLDDYHVSAAEEKKGGKDKL